MLQSCLEEYGAQEWFASNGLRNIRGTVEGGENEPPSSYCECKG